MGIYSDFTTFFTFDLSEIIPAHYTSTASYIRNLPITPGLLYVDLHSNDDIPITCFHNAESPVDGSPGYVRDLVEEPARVLLGCCPTCGTRTDTSSDSWRNVGSSVVAAAILISLCVV